MHILKKDIPSYMFASPHHYLLSSSVIDSKKSPIPRFYSVIWLLICWWFQFISIQFNYLSEYYLILFFLKLSIQNSVWMSVCVNCGISSSFSPTQSWVCKVWPYVFAGQSLSTCRGVVVEWMSLLTMNHKLWGSNPCCSTYVLGQDINLYLPHLT